MDILFANNAVSKLRSALSAAQTILEVQTGTGELFPSPTGDQYFKLTVEDRRTLQIEIMHCIGRSGDVLTVVRGQEDFEPQAFLAGATVSHRWTRDSIQNVVDQLPPPNPFYLGAYHTPPATDNEGGPLKVGQLYLDLDDNHLWFWTGASWVDPIGTASITTTAGVFIVNNIVFDGVTTDFNLRYTDYAAVTHTPDTTIAESFVIWINGVAQQPGVDYTIPVVGTIHFTTAPEADALFHGIWVAVTVGVQGPVGPAGPAGPAGPPGPPGPTGGSNFDPSYVLRNVAGTASAITALSGYSIPALAANQMFRFKPAANSVAGGTTISIDGLGAVPLKSPNGLALDDDDIHVGFYYDAVAVGTPVTELRICRF